MHTLSPSFLALCTPPLVHSEDGGAIWIAAQTDGTSWVNLGFMSLISNSAQGRGGAIYFGGLCSYASLYSLSANDNSAAFGGAIWLGKSTWSPSITYSNNTQQMAYYMEPALSMNMGTFSSNMASQAGGAVASIGRLYMNNQQLSNNTSPQGGAIYLNDTSATFYYR